jgi:ABC-type sugar transport system substrate-binding protein
MSARQPRARGRGLDHLASAAVSDPGISRRRLLAVGGGAVAAAALSGCHVPVIAPGVDRSSKRKLIGLSLYADDAYTRAVASGVAAAVKGSGYQLLARRADLSASAESANLQSFINRKATGFIDLPVSVETSTRGAQMGQAASLACVNALYPGPGGQSDKFWAAVVSYGGEDGGNALARYVAQKAPQGGEVIVVQGLPGQGASEPMDRGLDAGLAGHPNLRVVARGPGGLTADGALAVVRNAFAQHPNAKIVIDYNAVMGDAIAGFLRATGRRDVLHVTAGATPATGALLGTPFLNATLYWSAAEVGRTAAEALLSVVKDEDEQGDPFVHTIDQSMRTTLRGAPPNQTTARVAIQPPVPQTQVEPAPETPAGGDTSTVEGGG